MTDYLLDANVLIQAKNLHYGFDFCPAFWDWLEEQNRTGKVASIGKGCRRTLQRCGQVEGWDEARGDDFFLRPDDTLLPALRTVRDWASSQAYEPAAVATFLQVADYWLVAHVVAYNSSIVSHEVPADTTRKIRIPNACISLGLRCSTPYGMLHREGTRFVLG